MESVRRGGPCILSIAPMMEWTDRHYRYMMRFLTRKTMLYTEMITAPAILLGDKRQHLDFSETEHPIAIQLGGNDPEQLREAAIIAEDWGYDEINLNVGCPSSKVQGGAFGACLMARPEQVADIVTSIRNAVKVPVTVKHRIGIDDLDRYEDLAHFVDVVRQSGCDRFIVHARIALLQGLSPKENRRIPPLRYEDVFRLKAAYPDLLIEGNGHVKTLDRVEELLETLDGVMIGRAAYETPAIFADADRRIYGEDNPGLSMLEVVESMIPYIEARVAAGTPQKCITRHMMNLFKGMSGARRWRRTLSEKTRGLGARELFEEGLVDIREGLKRVA